jgi:hypothetical protein
MLGRVQARFSLLPSESDAIHARLQTRIGGSSSERGQGGERLCPRCLVLQMPETKRFVDALEDFNGWRVLDSALALTSCSRQWHHAAIAWSKAMTSFRQIRATTSGTGSLTTPSGSTRAM